MDKIAAAATTTGIALTVTKVARSTSAAVDDSSTAYHPIDNKSTSTNADLEKVSEGKAVALEQSLEVANDAASQGLVGPRLKRGHKFCGCCCDVRRAVLIVNIIRTALTIYLIAVVLSVEYFVKDETPTDLNVDDDITIAAFTQLKRDDAPITTVIFMACLQLFCSSVGILGAVCFHVGCVAVAALPLFVNLVASLIRVDLVGVLAATLFLYPHIFLVKELREGIMSKETYESTERFSCCCV